MAFFISVGYITRMDVPPVLKKTLAIARSVGSAAGEILWPGGCFVCDQQAEIKFLGCCDHCWAKLTQLAGTPACSRCGVHTSLYTLVENRCGWCEDREFAFEGVFAAGPYEEPLRRILLQLKYQDAEQLARVLRELIGHCLGRIAWWPEVEMVIPVPLHWRRRLFRGFNQARILCPDRMMKKPVIGGHLVRIRPTSRQAGLTLSQRKKNVRGAFGLRPGHPFEGKTVCLIDDITTSRATLDECAQVLKAGGVKQVYAIAAASAGPGDL